MKINLEITLDNKLKELNSEILSAEIQKYISQQIDSQTVFLELIITGPKKIQGLNRKYRGINTPTDVLSFPIYKNKSEINKDRPILLGTIVINLYQAQTQATDKNISLTDECVFLACHSIDHLLGKHH